MKIINLELAATALEKANGTQFERFANAAFADLIGTDFIPLGGHKDWGADALLSTATFSKRPFTFFQFSIEENSRQKIRNTVARLLEVGRDIKTLYYATSIVVPRPDILENELEDELGVNIRIRDGNYFIGQINSSPAMIAAFESFLAPAVAYLSELKSSPLLADDDSNVNSAIYVFLQNELDSRDGGGPSEGVADGLIIWALRDTDSELKKFLTEKQIFEQIEKDVPGITSVIGKLIFNRIKVLSKLPQSEKRPIKHFTKQDYYCISFNLRKKMRDENLQAEALRRQVLVTYRNRILILAPSSDPDFIDTVSRVSFRTIQMCLEKEGIEFAAFLSGKTRESRSIKARIDECLLEEGVPKRDFSRVYQATEVVLQEAFTRPTDEERTLYSRIASVYTILFCLRTEPKLIQYFEKMAGHLRLYVGADVLVQALGERFAPPNRMYFTNTMKLIRAAGGQLVLTEPVLEEVQHHVFAADQEFQNHYSDCEEAVTSENVDLINRPLIRAYFYGKLSATENIPKNWPQFLNNYCNPRAINSQKAREELRKYLMHMVGMEFENRQTVEDDCKDRDVLKLARLLEPFKKKKELAWNDALMAHLIYVRRASAKEADDLSGFGYRTWWLTNEFAITNLTKDIVAKEGSRYLMRPDYLLNFLSMLPKKQQAKAIFESLFPSLLGVHLARDHSPEQVERLHKYLEEIKAVDPARRRVLVAQKSDELKANLRGVSWIGVFNPQDGVAS